MPEGFNGVPGFDGAILSAQQGGIAQGVQAIPAHMDPYKGKFYQWMGGNNIGLVVEVERTVQQGSKQIVMLKDGIQLDVPEFQRMLKPVDTPPAQIGAPPTAETGIQTLPPNGQMSEADFFKSLQTSDNIPVPIQQPVQQPAQQYAPQPAQQVAQQMQQEPTDPVMSILAKKKINLTPVSVEIMVDLPKQSLVDMLVDDFDKTPYEIFDIILDEKNMARIKEQLINHLIKKSGRFEKLRKLESLVDNDTDEEGSENA